MSALSFERCFTDGTTHPYDMFEWGTRDVVQKNAAQEVIFEQLGVEFPTHWSETASTIVTSKYFRGHVGREGRESSLKDVVDRIVDTYTKHALGLGYLDQESADVFSDELKYAMVAQLFAFNSPVWFNVGVPGRPQVVSACYILSIADSLEDITSWIATESKIFQGGSGAGVNLSPLRGSNERLSAGGYASGPVSFMQAADSAAGAVKSGGSTRRSAKMVILDVDHPDVESFVRSKADEEGKIRVLQEAGYDMGVSGKDMFSVQYQNANNSVAITDEFMQAVKDDADWDLINRTDGGVSKTVRAKELFEQIAQAAWECADPGVFFTSTINRWHTIPNAGPITASNPCFPGDQRVLTTEGLIPIKELVERGEAGDVVSVYTNDVSSRTSQTERVVASAPVRFMRTGVNPIVRLYFDDGSMVRCTPNHSFFTTKGKVEAKDLTEDDLVWVSDSPAGRLGDRPELDVQQALEALEAGDMEVVSELATCSHASAVEFFLAACPDPAGDDILEIYVEDDDIARLVADVGNSLGLDISVDTSVSTVFVSSERLRALEEGTVDFFAAARRKKLVKRIDDGQEETFNITEPRNHSYVVGSTVVANCGEYMSIDNSSCNLASINLLPFLDEETNEFDVDRFEYLCRLLITAMDVSVSFAQFPTEEITNNTRAFRQLGLGVTNLGALLMSRGLPYDSDEGRDFAAAIISLMTGAAYHQSALVAAAVGPYDGFENNREPHLGVLEMHANASKTSLPYLKVGERAAQVWDDALVQANKFGVRNSQVSLSAPTGTISFCMDASTTGIEPDFALVKHKNMVGGGFMQLINAEVPRALRFLGYSPEQISDIDDYVLEHGHVVGAPHLDPEHVPVFDCAVGERAISPMGHVKMLAAIQPFLSGASSKTVNMPESATVADVADMYMKAWELGVKDLAIYRDNCKVGQPLSSKKKDPTEQVEPTAAPPTPTRRRLPARRSSTTTSFSVGGAEGYLTTGHYPDGSPGELFLRLGKQGSTLSGMLDAFSIAVSIGLQYGVPLETYVEKFANQAFEPAGMTSDPDVRMAKSIIDYVFRRMALDSLDKETREMYNIYSTAERTAMLQGGAAPTEDEEELIPAPPSPKVVSGRDSHSGDAPLCLTCGSQTIRAGACHICPSCGSTTGCS